ncbi:putative gustatory receptor 28b [Phymastichus coffea]|uniref:putative gustatory receptor 28b n=1 Tax=Phymastichus coffea TaxID=108790 RepID=UPI00273AB74C|nr:putative gustatory receptor 28b [Phymastichus coffea]
MYYIAAYLCDITIALMMLQYSLILDFVRKLFESINNELNKIMLAKTVECVLDKYNMKMTKLSRVRCLHMSLCEVCEDIEDFYSKPILFCTLYIFLTLILFAYYVARSLLFNNESLPTSIIIHCIFHIIQGITSLYLLINSTCAVVTESKRTGKVVNKLIGSLIDDQITNKLNQFSEYLLHQNLEFSAAGLFLLDGSLIMSNHETGEIINKLNLNFISQEGVNKIGESIVTYLVILLQFHGNDQVPQH